MEGKIEYPSSKEGVSLSQADTDNDKCGIYRALHTSLTATSHA